MALWTDIIDPATVTGFVRQSLSDYEAEQGTLARWLPNVLTPDINARFVVGQNGLVEEAQYRAYDAEPEVGKGEGGRRVTIELPAVGQNIPVTEYQQLRTRNASDEAMLGGILRTAKRVARAVADRTERMRGTVIDTGKATINQSNFITDDDFGRDAAMRYTVPILWSAATPDPLGDANTALDLWVTKNGSQPGSVLMSRKVFRALAASNQFRLSLVGGGSRPATDVDARAIWAGAGLPEIVVYDRRTSGGRVLPDDRIYFLPAPGQTEADEPSELGATFWGQTLTSTLSEYELADEEMPGIVVGVYRNEKPPAIAEVISDAINLPVLGNANLSMSVKVL